MGFFGRKDKRTERRDTVRPGLGRGSRPVGVLISIAILGLLAGSVLLYRWLVVDLPPPDGVWQRTAVPTTKIYDRQGRLLYEIIDPHVGKHTPLPLDDIPLTLRQATIATEDASFYFNPGVDPWAILRAIIINLRGGEVLSGGSTITQQLARNLLLSPEERAQRTLVRKLRETILAYRLARTFSKDDILALYLNETYYGNLAYGVEAAAQAYFGKQVGELDLAEGAMLAGLPQAPAVYDPLQNPEVARQRQAIVLDLMVKRGYVTAEQAELAKQEKLYFAAAPFPIRAPHFVMHVRQLLEDEYGLEGLYRGGLQVYTTLDVDMLDTAQSIVRYRLERLAEHREGMPGRNVRNAALVALDPQTGEVLAMLGSPDYFDPESDGAVNVALATRQPGSSIKPITYAAAFEPTDDESHLPLTAATMMLDVRTSFLTRENEPYVPHNYDRQFHGPVLLRTALGSSFNLIAVKVLDTVGLPRMMSMARRLGITTFDQSDRFGLALTLGGGEVRLLEMAAAYGAFANGGYRVEPAFIRRIEDSQGQVLYQWQPPDRRRVLDERVAYLITDILSDDLARISGFGEGSVLNLTRPAAVKTGTTTDWRDNWTIGYTPDLVVGVWAGNADNEPMRHVSGVDGAAPIWHDFMGAVLKAHPVRPFIEPPGMTRVEVCADSGLLPGPYCPNRRRELFVAGTEPTETCDLHRPVRIDRATGLLATENCPPGQIIPRVYTFLPAEAAHWARQQGLPQPPADYCFLHPSTQQKAQTEKGSTSTLDAQRPALIVTSPDPFTVYQLSSAIPLGDQRIEVAARPADGVRVAEVTLFVDGEPLGTYGYPPYREMWPVVAGEHVVRAEGVEVSGQRFQSDPIHFTVLE